MITVSQYTHSPQTEQKPELHECGFWPLFLAYEATPGFTPYLFAATDENGHLLGTMFAITKRCFKWFPPFLYHQAFVYGEGQYAESVQRREDIFQPLLAEAARVLLRRCWMVEFKHIRNGRFGYKLFREQKFVPVHWLEVHNSLHSRTPEERVFERVYRRIKKSEQAGTTIRQVKTDDEMVACVKLLRHYYASKPRRYCPPLDFFQNLQSSGTGCMLLVEHEERIIGASFVLFAGADAFLLYSAGLRKSFPQFAPGIMAVWGALKLAESQRCRHLRFTDAGLPFRTNPYRDFILSFGGTQQSTRRWFRFRWAWLNKILTKIYV